MDTRETTQPGIVRPISRRALIGGATKLAAGGMLAAAFAGSAQGWALAQSSSAGADLTSLGLPELKITATDTGYTGVPARTAAGRYLVTLDIQAKPYGAAAFLQLPADLTFQNFQQELAKAAGEDSAPPAWYYETYMAGGPGGIAGQTVQAVIDLKPGSYAIWGDDPTSSQKPRSLTVTGTASDKPVAPTAAATIKEVATAKGYAFDLIGDLKAGSQTVQVVNATDQPHFVEIDKSPVPLTQAQLGQLLMLGPNDKPPAGLPSPAQISQSAAAYIATQTSGVTSWHILNLTPGTYVFLCFVPDKNTSMPHAMEGMAKVVTVK